MEWIKEQRKRMPLTDYMHIYHNFQLVMSLSAMSLGLRFCTSRKGGTGGGGRVSTLGPRNMAASGLSCRKPLVIPGGPLLSSCAQMGLENGILAV